MTPLSFAQDRRLAAVRGLAQELDAISKDMATTQCFRLRAELKDIRTLAAALIVMADDDLELK